MIEASPTETLFERVLLRMLLAGDDPTLAALRAQLEGSHLSTRESSDDGFILGFDVAENMPLAPGVQKLRIDDVAIELEGLEHGAGCILWVAQGRLFQLEVFSFADRWPSEVGWFTLRYLGRERILQPLD